MEMIGLVMLLLIGVMVLVDVVSKKKEMREKPYLTRDFLKKLGDTKKEHYIHHIPNYNYGVKLVFKMRYATHVEVYYGDHREREYKFVSEAYQLNDTPNRVMDFGNTNGMQQLIEDYLKEQYELMEKQETQLAVK